MGIGAVDSQSWRNRTAVWPAGLNFCPLSPARVGFQISRAGEQEMEDYKYHHMWIVAAVREPLEIILFRQSDAKAGEKLHQRPSDPINVIIDTF
jgi:hypothetical protein